MIKPDFNTVSRAELRAYVIAHPDDKVSFSAFVDRFTSDASPETFEGSLSNLEIENLITRESNTQN